MNGKARDTSVEAGVTTFAPMGIASVCAERADTFDDCRKPVENLTHVIGNHWVKISPIRCETQRFPDGGKQALDVLLVRQPVPKLDQDGSEDALNNRAGCSDGVLRIAL